MWAIYTHNRYSEGARALAYRLQIPLYHENNKHRIRQNTKLINWGCSERLPVSVKLNNQYNVQTSINKIYTLTSLTTNNIPTVEWTTSIEKAKQWVQQGNVIYGRRQTSSHGGRGIVVISSLSEMILCPLYTKAILSPKEFRVHVFNNKIIDVTLKRRRNGVEVNEYIRNSDNGWVFTREGVTAPKSVRAFSKLAVRALGLNFGAVDIMFKDGSCYVLEINTAPGIEGTTLEKYILAFKETMYE